MRASERINERRVLPSLWPDGAGYGLDRILEGADLPSVWPERGAYDTVAPPIWTGEAQEAEAGAQPGGACQLARWESRWLLAHLQYWTHRLLGHAGLQRERSGNAPRRPCLQGDWSGCRNLTRSLALIRLEDMFIRLEICLAV